MAEGSSNGLTQELRTKANVIREGTRDGAPAIYKIPLTAGKNQHGSEYKSYFFGKGDTITDGHRVIMVVGATGSGKSTLINAMINHILQVDWTDRFRFQIISDIEENTSVSQAQTKTQTLVCYTIYPSSFVQLDYTFTIIDTPGFGDTRGLEQDKVITDRIREFFTSSEEHHIDHIDAIGFVVQAALPRLTQVQRYVFESVLSIFGKDVEDNIMILATFADGQEPAIKEALHEANIPCADKIYKFNNSALFAKIRPGMSFESLYWNMASESMAEFFLRLVEVQPRSISLTAEVLKQRKQLELTLKGLQVQIRVGISKMEELKAEQEILEGYKADVESNKDHTYNVKVVKIKQIQIGKRNSMNCTFCVYTCHQPCKSFDATRMLCEAFTWQGTCRVCPFRCRGNTHFVQAFKHEICSEFEKKTYEDIKKRYQEATKKKMSHEEIVKKHQEGILDVEVRLAHLIGESRSILSRLQEIALRPDPLNVTDYIDLLIQTETRVASAEWQSRVEGLQKIRENAELLKIIQQGKRSEEEQEKETERKQFSLTSVTSWIPRLWNMWYTGK